MDSIVMQGGNPIIGEINISGSKNAALPIMTASLLTNEDLILTNVPHLSDIETMKELLYHHGTKISVINQKNDSQITLSSKNISNFIAPYNIVKKMRASIWVLGPLLSRFRKAVVSLPGGCAIGERKVDIHLAVMKAFGASIFIRNGYIIASSTGKLRGCNFNFPKRSVGATINAILASILASGESNFTNCAIEPEILDLCNCLNSMGGEIHGIGTTNLHILGKERLYTSKYNILPDRIEAGTYMIAAAATRGDILLKGIKLDILENLTSYMRRSGTYIKEESEGIRIKHSGEIKPINISTEPYPGFSTDLQAQFMILMILANGKSEIEENIFENRFMHVPELRKMGADIKVNENKALVCGLSKLKGTEVVASDLRASVSLIIAGLVASGETKISKIYHLDRGYQSLEKKLSHCGANILRIKDNK